MKNYKRPMYSQKHYEDMAFELKHGIYNVNEKTDIVEFLVKVFKDDSSKFDEDRFRKATD